MNRLCRLFGVSARGGTALPRLVVAGGAVLLLITSLAQAHPNSFAPLARAQRKKVVHISTRFAESIQDGEDLNFPYHSPEPFQGTGSGFIISADGFILTNYHVIQDASDMEVVLEDEHKYRATLVGVDPRTDLALLRIPAKNLPHVTFGDSSQVEVGDWVVAIGNPLGLDYSVTAGIISAKGRNIFDAENVAYGEFLQTDAAINPGNSGGPLFNLQGEVIGVNTAISSRGQGIGFAVPSNLVTDVVRQLKEHGHVVRGWLGVVIQEVTSEWALSVGLPETTRGILVSDVVPGGPAAKANLRKGDVVLSYRGEKAHKVAHLQKQVALTPPGTDVPLEVLRVDEKRQGWRQQTLTAQVGKAPDERSAIAEGDPLQRLDIRLTPIDEAKRKKLGLPLPGGLLIEDLAPAGLGAEIGLHKGDIILEVDGQELSSVEELGRLLRKNRRSRANLLIQRKKTTLTLALPQWD